VNSVSRRPIFGAQNSNRAAPFGRALAIAWVKRGCEERGAMRVSGCLRASWQNYFGIQACSKIASQARKVKVRTKNGSTLKNQGVTLEGCSQNYFV
jgi:hypothetical protein